jgi:hypothetical protein
VRAAFLARDYSSPNLTLKHAIGSTWRSPSDKVNFDGMSLIRGANKVSQADGIHLATAAEGGVGFFLTNGGNLRKLSISGIKFLADLEGKVI